VKVPISLWQRDPHVHERHLEECEIDGSLKVSGLALKGCTRGYSPGQIDGLMDNWKVG
jgi:hypothetical protein